MMYCNFVFKTNMDAGMGVTDKFIVGYCGKNPRLVGGVLFTLVYNTVHTTIWTGTMEI